MNPASQAISTVPTATQVKLPKQIERWYPDKWSEFCGNTKAIGILKKMVRNGPTSFLISGPSRSGKTRLVHLLVRSLLCKQLLPDLSPCGECDACKELGDGRFDLHGIDLSLINGRFRYHRIDCTRVPLEEILTLNQEIHRERELTIIYLDEAAELMERKLDKKMLTLIESGYAIWIATAIEMKPQQIDQRSKPSKGKAIRKKKHGPSIPWLGRFPVKLQTFYPCEEDFRFWLHTRCQVWGIEIKDHEETVKELILRTESNLGYALHFLVHAALNDRVLDLDLVKSVDQLPRS